MVAPNVRLPGTRAARVGQARRGGPVTDRAALLRAYDEQVRAAEGRGLPPPAVLERDGPVLRVSGLHRGFVSTARDVGARGLELDALIARQRDWFAARGEAVEWKTRAHDEPADLCDRLLAAGFVPEPRETVVVARVQDVVTQAPVPAGVSVHEVLSAADMQRIAAMEGEVWAQDQSWLAAELVGQVGLRPRQTFVLVAETGEGPGAQIVSAAWLTLTLGTEFAGLWGGSTLAAWRGRGLYRALVSARARIAAEHGFRYLQVDASDESRPILERLGFVAITTTTPYVWSPPEQGADV
jgi:GNAT superfamily N-acetyltransferase